MCHHCLLLTFQFNVDIEDQLQEAIAWCERVVLETLAPTSNMEWNPKKMRNRKRKSDQSDPIDNSLCSSSMANTVLEVCQLKHVYCS